MDENTKIIGTLMPFSKDETQRAVIQQSYTCRNRRVQNVQPFNKIKKASGQPKFHSILILIAYLASILS